MIYLLACLALSYAASPLNGIWSGTETVVTESGLGVAYPITFLNITGPEAVFTDKLSCSGGCYIDAMFSWTGSSLAGYYHVGSPTAPSHGGWFMFLDGNVLRGLTYSFSSDKSYLIECRRIGEPDNVITSGAPLDGSWNGTEVLVTTLGFGASSNFTMTFSGQKGVFKDYFGCKIGCYLTSDYAYTGSAMIGYYHDTTYIGPIHGIWAMNVVGNSIFAFTVSYDSSKLYVLNYDATPPCPQACLPQTPSFTSNCGAWIVWRPLQGLPGAIHQAFAYDNNYHSPNQPSLNQTSGYYCCGDDHQSGQCVDCGSSSTTFTTTTVTNLGRVCGDSNPQYQLVLSTDGLSDLYPDELSKTCWFLNPTQNQKLNCGSLWQAERQIQPTWNECETYNVSPYDLFDRNCRDYVVAVMAAYCKIVGPTALGCTC